MKLNPFHYIRYILEFLIIITGVLLSFYLDDLRQLGEKESYKDTLIEELLVTSQEDLKQIEMISEDLNIVQIYIAEILADIEDGKIGYVVIPSFILVTSPV